MPELQTEFLMDMRVKLAKYMDCGEGPSGRRTVHIVEGGTVEGPRIHGRIIPSSSGEWALLRGDGSFHLDVRVCVETDDGATILLTSIGRMVPDPGDLTYAMDFDKRDDPAGAHRYYFRTSYTFETGDDRYAWMNHIVTAVKGRTGDGGVIYEMFQIL